MFPLRTQRIKVMEGLSSLKQPWSGGPNICPVLVIIFTDIQLHCPQGWGVCTRHTRRAQRLYSCVSMSLGEFCSLLHSHYWWGPGQRKHSAINFELNKWISHSCYSCQLWRQNCLGSNLSLATYWLWSQASPGARWSPSTAFLSICGAYSELPTLLTLTAVFLIYQLSVPCFFNFTWLKIK